MRSAKRLLSILIVMALSVSMMVNVFAFEDVAETHKNSGAIELLASLQIIGGYEDGTFRPDAQISREEFAKIVYVLINGTYDSTVFMGSTRFSDVASDRWSSGYINWATNMGIVGGYPDGTFKPADNVTIAEAAKMLVTALGYKAQNYTFPYGFIAQATQLKIFENVTQVGPDSKALRGTIAEMAKNTLFAENTPAFSSYDIYGNVIERSTVASKVFEINKVEGYLEGTSTALGNSSITEENKVLITSNEGSGVFEYTSNVDSLLLHRVNVWYKDIDKNNVLSSSDEIKSITGGINSTLTFTTSDIYQKSGDLVNFYVKDANGVEVNLGTGELPSSLVVNGKRADGVYTIDMLERNDTEITLINNNDAIGYDAAVIYELVNDVVSSVDHNIGRIVTLTTGFKDFKDLYGNKIINIDSDIADEDNVIIRTTATFYGNRYDITKAETILNAQLTKISLDKYTLGGKTYLMAADAETAAPSILGEEYDIVLDKKGNIISAILSNARALDNYFMIKDVNVNGTLLKVFTATVVMPDGSEKVLTMDKTFSDGKYFDAGRGWLDNSGKAYGEAGFSYDNVAALGKVFSYEMLLTATDTVASIKDLDNSKGAVIAGGIASLDASTGAFSMNDQIKGFIDDTTVLYVKKEIGGIDYVDVYTGKNIPSFGMTQISQILVDDTLASPAIKILVAEEELKGDVLSQNKNIGLLIDRTLAVGSQPGKVYFELTLAINGEIKTYNTVEELNASLLPAYGVDDRSFVKVEFTSDNKVRFVTDLIPGTSEDFNQGFIKSKNGSFFNFASFDYDSSASVGSKITNVKNNYYQLTADAKIYTMDGTPLVNGQISKIAEGEIFAVGSSANLIPGNTLSNFIVNYHVVPFGDDMGKVDVVFVYQIPING